MLFWQESLGLKEWDLAIRLASPLDLEGGSDVSAEIRMNLPHKSATVYICRDLLPMETWRWETLLVHELLHLHFEQVVDQEARGTRHYNLLLEQIIGVLSSGLAKALLNASGKDGTKFYLEQSLEEPSTGNIVVECDSEP